MNRVEIIAVGNEILSGRILDSNSHWLAQAIGELDRLLGRHGHAIID